MLQNNDSPNYVKKLIEIKYLFIKYYDKKFYSITDRVFQRILTDYIRRFQVKKPGSHR